MGHMPGEFERQGTSASENRRRRRDGTAGVHVYLVCDSERALGGANWCRNQLRLGVCSAVSGGIGAAVVLLFARSTTIWYSPGTEWAIGSRVMPPP